MYTRIQIRSLCTMPTIDCRLIYHSSIISYFTLFYLVVVYIGDYKVKGSHYKGNYIHGMLVYGMLAALSIILVNLCVECVFMVDVSLLL